jgi:hypothetical protein
LLLYSKREEDVSPHPRGVVLMLYTYSQGALEEFLWLLQNVKEEGKY